jgi:hypothetical protein
MWDLTPPSSLQHLRKVGGVVSLQEIGGIFISFAREHRKMLMKKMDLMCLN